MPDKKLSHTFALPVFCCLFLLITTQARANESATIEDMGPEPTTPVYHLSLEPEVDQDDTTPTAQAYYKELKSTVDQILHRKIKKKLYQKVFPQDLLQSLYDENVIEPVDDTSI
ncbi:MAG: hypothetical protein ACD_62C00225G0004 [uncultured bacterium]|nr:MAG: hypothetical protein ACD_62C00225G0004 [uncultured bacterium]